MGAGFLSSQRECITSASLHESCVVSSALLANAGTRLMALCLTADPSLGHWRRYLCTARGDNRRSIADTLHIAEPVTGVEES